MRNFLKRKLHGYILKYIFRLPTEEDIMRVDKQTGKVYLNGHELDDSQRKELANSARVMKDLPAYSMLSKALIRHAGKRMYYSSKTVDDIVSAKMILYTVDMMEKMRDNVSKL